MPYEQEAQRLYMQEYRKNNPEKCKAARLVQQAKLRSRNAEYVKVAKNKPCMDCDGLFPPYVMDFDHIDDNKVDNVSVMVHKMTSLEKIQLEIDKCELVCSNCHRIRTHQRNNAPFV